MPQQDNIKNIFIKKSAGIVCIILSLILSINYFTFKDTAEALKKLNHSFYARLNMKWFKTGKEALSESIRSVTATPWQTVIIRSAYGRWRLKSIAPEAFGNLMQYYENSLFLLPSAKDFNEIFTASDKKWLSARKEKLLTSGEEIKYTVIHEESGLYEIKFPPFTYISSLGSMIRITVDMPAGELPYSKFRLLWCTDKSAYYDGYRSRIGLCLPEVQPLGEKNRYTIEFDMSWEPSWISSDLRIQKILFTGVKNFKIFKLDFTDSCHLQP